MYKSTKKYASARRNGRENFLIHYFFILLTLFLISFLSMGLTEGDSMIVSPGESIQYAVNEAKDGDSILVEGGLYKENLILNKEIVLKGTGHPKVDSGNFGSTITLNSKGVTLEGFTITGSGFNEKDSGIKVVSQNCTIRNNTITENGIGISLQDAKNIVISGNTIENNNIGIYLETSWGNEISFNRIAQNGEGIHITKNNFTKSVSKTDGEGVYIRHVPKNEASIKNVREIALFEERIENYIYQNEFLRNDGNAYDDGDNFWDKENKGNWYDDFDAIEEGCKDHNEDGICDNYYQIAGGSSVDQYPLASEDAIFRHKIVSKDYELSTNCSSYLPEKNISLSFKVADNFSGWVELKPTNQSSNKADDAHSYHIIDDSKGTIDFQAPSEEGSYQFRMYDEVGTEIVTLPFKVAVPALSIAPTSISTCEKVEVKYSGAPGNEGDWVGLYNVGAQKVISKQYLKGRNDGTLIFTAPSISGRYEFRMFEEDVDSLLVSSEPLEAEALSGVRITASPSEVQPGGTVEISFWGAKPASAVGMYEMTSPDKYMIDMQYANGRSCGTMTFKLPSKRGKYDFRLFENNVYRKIMGASNVVTVN